jgi:hypothetical protein
MTILLFRYFKDIRTAPIEFEGDVSGDSASEDECDLPTNDLCYLSTEKSGFLLKRSYKDVNVWRRRRCIITDTSIWCVHEQDNKHRVTQIVLDGPVYLHEDLAELNYPFGLAVQSNRKTFFFRASSTEEQYAWLEEITQRAQHTTENSLLSMAEVIISGEEERKNQHCSSTLKGVLRGGLLSAITRERLADRAESSATDNADDIWTAHSFHSNHPLCGAAIAFIIAVSEEYKEMYRKFVRPSVDDFWDCAVGIYKRFILTQIVQTSRTSGGKSLCFPSFHAVGETMVESKLALKIRSPSYLIRGETALLKLQQTLSVNIRWRTHEEVLAETARMVKSIRDRSDSNQTNSKMVASFWYGSWYGSNSSTVTTAAPKPEAAIDSEQLLAALNVSSSRYHSRRHNCSKKNVVSSDSLSADAVLDYVIIDKSKRPPPDLYDEIVDIVTHWLDEFSENECEF